MDWFIYYSKYTAEFLFYLTNGIPLYNSYWFLLYGIIMAIFMGLPYLLYGQYIKNNFLVMLSVVSMFPILLLGMAPIISQGSLTHECRYSEVIVYDQPINIKECRTKENYYGEYGNWKIVQHR